MTNPLLCQINATVPSAFEVCNSIVGHDHTIRAVASSLHSLPVYSQLSLVLIAPTYRGMARLGGQAWATGSAQRQCTHPKMLTHPGTNRARRSTTSLIETNALPLGQTTNQIMSHSVLCSLASSDGFEHHCFLAATWLMNFKLETLH